MTPFVALLPYPPTGRDHGKKGKVRGEADEGETERPYHRASFFEGVSERKCAAADDRVDQRKNGRPQLRCPPPGMEVRAF